MTPPGDSDSRERVATILRELLKAGKLTVLDYERVLAALYGLDGDG